MSSAKTSAWQLHEEPPAGLSSLTRERKSMAPRAPTALEAPTSLGRPLTTATDHTMGITEDGGIGAVGDGAGD